MYATVFERITYALTVGIVYLSLFAIGNDKMSAPCDTYNFAQFHIEGGS